MRREENRIGLNPSASELEALELCVRVRPLRQHAIAEPDPRDQRESHFADADMSEEFGG